MGFSSPAWFEAGPRPEHGPVESNERNTMGKITWQGVAAGVVIGIILAPQISKLPLLNKLPQV
jgi:hypothetical protein